MVAGFSWLRQAPAACDPQGPTNYVWVENDGSSDAGILGAEQAEVGVVLILCSSRNFITCVPCKVCSPKSRLCRMGVRGCLAWNRLLLATPAGFTLAERLGESIREKVSPLLWLRLVLLHQLHQS